MDTMLTKLVGHVEIYDTTDASPVLLLDKSNAIHPQNMSRIIARALANEKNSNIYRIAFGNGGTVVDAAHQITYKPVNDGFPPDPAGWRSQLYNETYSEIVDDSNISIGYGPGSSPENDPPSVENSPSGPGVTSAELLSDPVRFTGISQVTIRCVLNSQEPLSQPFTDIIGNPATNVTEYTELPFTFDEIGLFTAGLGLQSTSGYQNVNVGTRAPSDPTGLNVSASYAFDIIVDGVMQTVNINTMAVGAGPNGEILYDDLVSLINQELSMATCSLSNAASGNTYGYLKFISNTTGTSSTVLIEEPASPIPNWLFEHLTNYVQLEMPVGGKPAGVDNDPVDQSNEAERMLTHLIFSPMAKTANREFTIIYKITVYVGRSRQVP